MDAAEKVIEQQGPELKDGDCISRVQRLRTGLHARREEDVVFRMQFKVEGIDCTCALKLSALVSADLKAEFKESKSLGAQWQAIAIRSRQIKKLQTELFEGYIATAERLCAEAKENRVLLSRIGCDPQYVSALAVKGYWNENDAFAEFAASKGWLLVCRSKIDYWGKREMLPPELVKMMDGAMCCWSSIKAKLMSRHEQYVQAWS